MIKIFKYKIIAYNTVYNAKQEDESSGNNQINSYMPIKISFNVIHKTKHY